ncbi:hypothetical protein [Streptomyces sp. PSKA30]|uniref:hypothetical protein n=1 Tax=Streptomyces sp. PSKA30 TaxID=2874597 RepID=UPI0027E20A1A|nr:hypothetical protein [Streptomyces sp. PSKA30]
MGALGAGSAQRQGVGGIGFAATLGPGGLDRVRVVRSQIGEHASAELAQAAGLRLDRFCDDRVDASLGPGCLVRGKLVDGVRR